jgi:hypothetical protein
MLHEYELKPHTVYLYCAVSHIVIGVQEGKPLAGGEAEKEFVRIFSSVVTLLNMSIQNNII